jgi:Asp-tRNA(Asn)/Glu-tRNA(Gln) amidotransferase A subunit family amidase
VDASFTAAVEEFGRVVGRTVTWLPPGILDGAADDVWEAIYAPEDVFAVGAERLRAGYQWLDPRVRRWVDRGLASTLDDYLEARHARTRYVLVLDELLGSGNVLLTPTVTAPTYALDGPAEAGGELMPIDLFNTAAMNLTGHPAVSVPAGSVEGMPLGLQMVGPRGSDFWLVELARTWERTQPWPLTAPGFDTFVALR